MKFSIYTNPGSPSIKNFIEIELDQKEDNPLFMILELADKSAIEEGHRLQFKYDYGKITVLVPKGEKVNKGE